MNLKKLVYSKKKIFGTCLLILNLLSFLLYLTVKKSNVVILNDNVDQKRIEEKPNSSKQLSENDSQSLKSVNYAIKETNDSKKNQCALIPEKLVGRLKIDTNSSVTLEQIENENKNLNITNGGMWSPSDCVARHKVAIIIPFRNRDINLKIFLRHIHPILCRQQLDYGIFIIEPIQNITFNRGLLMNIGFIESLNKTNQRWDCFVFHDVDLIPEDDRNIYSCPEQPRHMSSAVNTFHYRLPYETIFGGVSALTKDQMKKVNGYSNMYFGWGGEDDDFRARIIASGFQVSRYPLEIGRYLMVNHPKDQQINPDRFKLLYKAKERFKFEGLNSIEYEIVEILRFNLYTKIKVNYDQNSILNKKYR